MGGVLGTSVSSYLGSSLELLMMEHRRMGVVSGRSWFHRIHLLALSDGI